MPPPIVPLPAETHAVAALMALHGAQDHTALR